MIFLATVNLWGGVVVRYEPVTLICSVASMLMIGFVEEILFRGLLLEALEKQGSVKFAIVVSSLTFGLGHIVNLLNGSEVIPTFLQLIYATAIGIMLSVFTVTVKNILPCCLFHGVFNALSAFHNETLLIIRCQVILCVIISAVSLGYAAYLWKRRDNIKRI